MARLLFIRHGETEWNREGKYTGQSNIPLNENGIAQARALQAKLADMEVVAVFSSDLQRARHTAELAIGENSSLEIHCDSRLREIHQGEWEGMHFDDIKSEYAKEFAKRAANPLEVAPPGGESVGELKRRVVEVVQEIANSYPGEEQTVLISSHGLAIAIARTHFGDIPIEAVFDHIPSNAEIVEIIA